MNSNKDIHIIKCGASTPVGTTAEMTADMVRMGISRLAQHSYITDENDEPVLAGQAFYIDELIYGVDRFLALTIPPIKEALKPVKQLKEITFTIPLFLGIPQSRPGLPELFSKRVKESVSGELDQYPVDFVIHMMSHGHSSGLIALEEAIIMIDRGETDFCLIGGVESYHHHDSFKWLEESERLLCSDNNFGFVPGEAAGFFLIASEKFLIKYNLTSLGKIVSVGTEMEENLIGMDTVCTGSGLSKILDRVLQQLPPNQKISQTFCDLNGERYRTDEYGFSGLRFSQHFDDFTDFIAPAESLGDVGPATAPLLINLITDYARKGYTKGNFNLIWTSSDSGERSALLIETS